MTNRCVAVVLAAGSVVSAQSITTAFNGTTTLAGGNVGTYMDVTAQHASGITIQSFDVNCNVAAGTPVGVEVYYRPGTYVGFDQSAAGWVSLGVGMATSAGTGLPTHIAIGGLYIPNGQVYGIRMNHLAGGVRYNSAATTTAVHQNGDVRLDLGAAQGALFTGTLNAPRGWNGTLYYTPGNTPVTGGCCLPNGVCTTATQGSCTGQDGVYFGDGAPCDLCPQPGACCLPDACVSVLPARCTQLGGVFHGMGSVCAAGLCGNILSSNGTTINEVGTGFGGANVSRAAPLLNTAGSAATLDAAGPQFRLADDVTVPTGQTWTVDSVTVYGYITAPAGTPYSTPPASPFTAVDVRVWNGVPDAVGSTVIATSSTLAQTDWTGVYRVFAGAASNTTDRPVMFLRAPLNGLQLGPGTYWIDYQLTGTFVSVTAGWSPYIMDAGRIPGVTTPGNARQLVAAGWAQTAISVPLTLRGTTSGACYANCDSSTVPPILNVQDFSCFLNQFASGETYANCDHSTVPPVLNVQDFSCFLNQFASGCS